MEKVQKMWNDLRALTLEMLKQAENKRFDTLSSLDHMRFYVLKKIEREKLPSNFSLSPFFVSGDAKICMEDTLSYQLRFDGIMQKEIQSQLKRLSRISATLTPN
jgi:hypothetical protein